VTDISVIFTNATVLCDGQTSVQPAMPLNLVRTRQRLFRQLLSVVLNILCLW